MRLEGARCVQCLSRRLAPGSQRCLQCLAHPPKYERLFALYDYQPPFDSVIQALKFRRLEFLAEALGTTAWDHCAEELASVEALSPVPLPWLRRVQRGFNQAEVLATALGRLLERPVIQPLVRRRSQRAIVAGNWRRTSAQRAQHAPSSRDRQSRSASGTQQTRSSSR